MKPFQVQPYFVCFERPVQSRTWTLAYRKNGTVFISQSITDAKNFALEVINRKTGNCSRIVRIDLPSDADGDAYAVLDAQLKL